MSVIFLAGVHGVGKSFLGTQISNSIEITHLTASQLIREEKGQATWGTNKKTSDLDDNQLALIRAISQKRLTNKNIVLDGHFVLRNERGTLTALATAVFKELRLSGVILLTDETAVIASRLALRDKGMPHIREIADLAAAESSHAQIVCNALGLPLKTIHIPTLDSLTNAVKGLIDS